MSKVLYQASPSMVRMNPLGTVLVVLLGIGGILAAVLAQPVAAAVGLPPEASRYVGLAGIVLLGLAFLRLLTWWATTKLDHLVIKEDEIVWTHGLLNKQYTEINMGSVRTVRVNQSLMQRLMNAGDVVIFTSGDVPELVVRGLPDPRAIRDYIKGEPAAVA